MNRKPKLEKPPSTKPKTDSQYIVETRHYKVITPLYGGGVEPEKADPISVIRATEIRGHLRFWWRATRGGDINFGGDLKNMKSKENEIWGSTNKSSNVSIAVDIKNKGNAEVAFRVVSKQKQNPDGTLERKADIETSPRIAPYAAFPLLPDKKESKKIGWESEKVLFDVEFELSITYPVQYQNDIDAALWAWETFGGIGARTRRGFGAIQENYGPLYSKSTSLEIKNWIKEQLNNHVIEKGRWPAGVPHLNAKDTKYKFTPKSDDRIKSWQKLILALQEFRQKNARFNKEKNEPDQYGLSRWPEANAIRKLYGIDPKLPEGLTPETVTDKYPRAVFGLPIIFHMPHDEGIKDDLNLRGVKTDNINIDRLASPLILRPLECKDGAVGLAVILEWESLDSDEPYTPPGGLHLFDGDIDTTVSRSSKLKAQEAAQIPPLKGETDVLKAFLKSLKG